MRSRTRIGTRRCYRGTRRGSQAHAAAGPSTLCGNGGACRGRSCCRGGGGSSSAVRDSVYAVCEATADEEIPAPGACLEIG